MAAVLDETIPVEPGRLQSPSSILTYKQCPRKYFYQYIAKLPTSPSIHLVRGSIAHKVLEDIYDLDTKISFTVIPDERFLINLKFILQEMFHTEWEKRQVELNALGLSIVEIKNYYDETRVMINNFFHFLVDKMQPFIDRGVPVKEAFFRVKPQREVLLHSPAHHVRGFADAIHEENGKVVILDYKTSKKLAMSDEYKLQLGIYSLIYQELFRLPDEVGVFFLKHGREMRVPVTTELVENARHECNAIHMNTKSKEVQDYPKKPGPLCKWSTGQCDFYNPCFSKTINESDDALVGIGKKGE